MIFADPTTGAQNDIDRATTIARQMVTEYGMSDTLGPMRFGHPQGEVFLGRDFTSTPDYSEEVAASIDAEVRALIDFAHVAANDVLTQNRAILDALALELIRHETLEAVRVQELFADVAMWQGDSSGPGARSARRPDGAAAAPSRSNAAAARQTEQPHRRPGGPA
jgi:cell division protease FtsH